MTTTSFLQDGELQTVASTSPLAYVRREDLATLLAIAGGGGILVATLGAIAFFLAPLLDPDLAFIFGVALGWPGLTCIRTAAADLLDYRRLLAERRDQHHDDLYLDHLRRRGADDAARAIHLCELLRYANEPHHREVVATVLRSAITGEASATVSQALADAFKHDPDPHVRAAAVTALGASPTCVGDHVAALVDSLRNDRHAVVRRAAAKTLRYLADDTVTAAMLQALISEPDDDVSFWLRDALRWRPVTRPTTTFSSTHTSPGVH